MAAVASPGDTSLGLHDVADFLKAHEPFTGLEQADLDRLAKGTEVEFFTAGTVIFKQGEPPPNEMRVIRRGAVELVENGRLLDLLEDGEMFGQAWMFSGLPTGWEARARDDTLCYALPADEVVPLLTGPKGLRFVARALLMLPRPGEPVASNGGEAMDPAQQPAGALAHEGPLICDPDLSLRDAARRMVETGASSILVRLERGGLGIVTDRDVRTRVVAMGLSPDTPVRDVLTTPVYTVRADQPVDELMLAMIDHNIRHVPVVSDADEVLGVVTDLDLLAAQARTPFVLRREIATAESVEELHGVTARFGPAVVSLHSGGLAAGQISAIISVIVETLLRRVVELVSETMAPAPAEFAWLSLGSHGRHEAAPSSDVDSGLVWEDGGDESTAAYMHELANRVGEALGPCGLSADTHGVTASGQLMARSAGGWHKVIRDWMSNATDDAVMATSVLLDGHSIAGPADAFGLFSDVHEARRRLLRPLLRLALAVRPPTGFLHDIVVEHSGEHRGSFDIKRGGLLPIVGVARYAGLAADSKSRSTIERLRAAGAAGVLDESEATTLEHAFMFMTSLRIEHQVRELEEGREPDDYVDPKALDGLTRRNLREAFRLVASTQKGLATGLAWDK
jgi:CBS domain-containing protein